MPSEALACASARGAYIRYLWGKDMVCLGWTNDGLLQSSVIFHSIDERYGERARERSSDLPLTIRIAGVLV